MADIITYKASFYTAAETLLSLINAVYVEAGEQLPDRQYVTAGRHDSEVVHDCEAVSVIIEQGFNGTPSQRVQTPSFCHDPRSVTLTVEVVRCQPVPSRGRGTDGTIAVADLNATALTQATDMFLLMEAGLRLGEADFNDRIDRPGALADVTVGRESGGMQAVVLTVTTVV